MPAPFDPTMLGAPSQQAWQAALDHLATEGPSTTSELAGIMACAGITGNWARSILAGAARSGVLCRRQSSGNTFTYWLPATTREQV